MKTNDNASILSLLETSDTRPNGAPSFGEVGLENPLVPKTECANQPQTHKKDSESLLNLLHRHNLRGNVLFENEFRNGFCLGSYVRRIMNCGSGGYDLYLDSGKKVHFSALEFQAWKTGQSLPPLPVLN